MYYLLFLVIGLLTGLIVAWIINRNRVSGIHRLIQQQKEALERELRAKQDENTEWLKTNSELNSLARSQKFQLEELQQEADRKQERILELTRMNGELSAAHTALQEKLETRTEEIIRFRKESQLEFEHIANKILEEKSKRFTETNRQNLDSILRPLGENLDKFRQKVEETYDKESKERFSLEKTVKELALLNQQISQEANNLTNALKGNNKIQGNWGEMILENILEQSGLQKNREYFLQETIRDDAQFSVKDEEGRRMIPDVIVHYPDRRKVIIDSKVSLTAYVKYTHTEDKGACDKLAARHLASVRRHVDQLHQRNYQAYIDSLDFVMMFIPNEPAYMLALQTDSELWNYGYRKGVLIISPTNLITSLRLIHDLWSREYQNRNALAIADRGAQLYDKFAGLVENMIRIGENLDRTRSTFEEAMGQLKTGRGNLIGQVEKLRSLGVKARKKLPLSEPSEETETGPEEV
ncbi:MAG: DNA recombination protein RmuC [Rikenellaceae bacterium]|nr:DNA recombination protein RmuC [Rikenellaceae bacterium]